MVGDLEDPRFAGSALCVPNGNLRERARDILTPVELAQPHRIYRCRLRVGATYRADMWALLDAEPTLSATELAQRTYGSFGAAREVLRDGRVWRDAGRSAHAPSSATDVTV